MKKIVFLVFGLIIGSFSMFFYNYLNNSNDSYEIIMKLNGIMIQLV